MHVKVYWNSKKKRYSVQVDNRVAYWTDELTLEDVEFRVSESGRQRVLAKKRKNVHAKVHGRVTDRACNYCDRVVYNPYLHEQFVLLETNEPIHRAKLVKLEVADGSPRIYIGEKQDADK